jgi:parallel beta-helix repeat protein
MDGEDMSKAEVVAPVAKQLVLLQGDPNEGKLVEHLHLKGIRFMHTDWPIEPEGHSDAQAAFSVPGAIQAVGARFCSVEGCEIAHVGTYGVWFRRGCQDNRILQNEIRDLGAGGVRIGEGASPETDPDAACRNVIDNNFIHDGGKIFRGAVGVWIGRSSYNTVSHNEVSDLDYTGLSIGWCWGYAPSSANHNIIEYNHVHHIGRGVLSDMGGIYTLGISPGTVIRYNIFHDISSYSYGGWGIYTDEGSSEILIENNIAYNTKTGGFHQHYGRENSVRNNIFAFSKEGQIIRSREEDHISFTFERNIVYFNNGQLLGSNWGNGNYRLDYNVYWDTSNPEITFAGMSFQKWQAKGRDTHSIIADPLFVNAEQFDFRLKPESPAIKLGFKPIDMSENGLCGPPDWVARPKKIKR